jgi:hypothetical protein
MVQPPSRRIKVMGVPPDSGTLYHVARKKSTHVRRMDKKSEPPAPRNRIPRPGCFGKAAPHICEKSNDIGAANRAMRREARWRKKETLPKRIYTTL